MAKRRGFTLIDMQFLAADIKRTEGYLSEFVYHLDGTREQPRIFCKPVNRLELHDELRDKPAPTGKKRKKSRTRAKAKPPVPINPDWNAEQIAHVISDSMGDE
jgi:hypothetical protein